MMRVSDKPVIFYFLSSRCQLNRYVLSVKIYQAVFIGCNFQYTYYISKIFLKNTSWKISRRDISVTLEVKDTINSLCIWGTLALYCQCGWRYSFVFSLMRKSSKSFLLMMLMLIFFFFSLIGWYHHVYGKKVSVVSEGGWRYMCLRSHEEMDLARRRAFLILPSPVKSPWINWLAIVP